MKSLKLFASIFITFVSILSANSALGVPTKERIKNEDVLRAANENNARLVQVIRELKEGKKASALEWSLSATASTRRHCDEDDDQQTCVPQCSSRYSDGSCMRYGSDFCGPNANCVENCTSRYSDGSCMRYGPDYCGNNVSCTPNCTARYSDGTCMRYGPDNCY